MIAKIQEKLTTQSPSDFFISFIDLIWAIPLITFFIVIDIIRAATNTGSISIKLKYIIVRLNEYAR